MTGLPSAPVLWPRANDPGWGGEEVGPRVPALPASYEVERDAELDSNERPSPAPTGTPTPLPPAAAELAPPADMAASSVELAGMEELRDWDWLPLPPPPVAAEDPKLRAAALSRWPDCGIGTGGGRSRPPAEDATAKEPRPPMLGVRRPTGVC